MSAVPTQIREQIVADAELAAEVDSIDTPKLTLGDLIRAGSAHTVKVENWGGDDQACALSAAAIAADALGVIATDK